MTRFEGLVQFRLREALLPTTTQQHMIVCIVGRMLRKVSVANERKLYILALDKHHPIHRP